MCVCAGEGRGSDYEGVSAVDMSELLGEIRQLRVQLERSIQINTTLRERLEQELLTRTDHKSTININYLLHKTGTHTNSNITLDVFMGNVLFIKLMRLTVVLPCEGLFKPL